MHTRFIELAGEINTAMPAYVVQKTADALNEAGKPLKGSRVLVLGIAYKKNVDDMRESPSVELMKLFQAKGSGVHYSDPFFAEFPRMRKHTFQLSSVPLSADSLSTFDAVVLATDHDAFNYPLIEAHSQLLIDMRGRFAPGHQIVRAWLAMVLLERRAALVVTDSGGVQKEAFLQSTPCVTVRRETEWAELLACGWNQLAYPADPGAMLMPMAQQLELDTSQPRPPLYGDGHAAEAIVGRLQELCPDNGNNVLRWHS